MLQLQDYPFIYFVGIGGIGMSSLARFLHKKGHQVFGYDRLESSLVIQLRKEGIMIHCDDLPTAISKVVTGDPRKTLVIYTPGVPMDNPILNHCITAGYQLQSRSAILGVISKEIPTIAVAGTHGKTTTTAIIAHMLYQTDKPILAFVGGILNLYNTNLIHNCLLDSIQLLLVEADEFNRSFLDLTPTYSVVTSADADHPETYATPELVDVAFMQFMQQNQQMLLIHNSVSDQLQVGKQFDRPFRTYGLDGGDIMADNLSFTPSQSIFDYLAAGVTLSNLVLPIPGWYNVENALAAITVCLELGVTEEQIRHSLASFPGVVRRFSFIFNNEHCVLINDYAHHPTAINALLISIKQIYPNSDIMVIFQPNLFSRTQAFYSAFAESLSLADAVFLLPVYAMREKPIPAVTSMLIFNKLTCKRKQLLTLSTLLALLTSFKFGRHQVIITIGGGEDIDAAVPAITDILKKIFYYSS